MVSSPSSLPTDQTMTGAAAPLATLVDGCGDRPPWTRHQIPGLAPDIRIGNRVAAAGGTESGREARGARLGEELVDQAWEKHSHDHFRAPTAHDMEILIKICLMPLAIKTQNDSFTFVHELKQEMHADLKFESSIARQEHCHSELKTSIEKIKGKSVDTNFEKQSILGKPPSQPIRNRPVIRQPTAYKSERSQLPRHRFASQVGVSHNLTKPVTPHSWPQVRKSSFAKPYDVNAPGPSRKSPKHVSFQSPKESVGSNDMVHNYYLEEAKKKAQLHNDKTLNTKPRLQQSTRSPNTTNGNKPKPRNFNQQPRNWPPSMSSHVSNRNVNTAEPPRNQKPFLKSKDLACPTCKKCIYSANHDECILKYLSKVNSRTSIQKKDAQSNKTTKRYIPVKKKRESRNHGRRIPIGQRCTPNKSSNVYLKTMTPRSGLTWKPMGRIFTHVGLKWIPIRKSVETRYNTNDSASSLGKETHNPKTVICANSSSLSADNNLFFKEKENVRFSAFILNNKKRNLFGLELFNKSFKVL
ncbi:hypothetical protein Tco_0128428 [Tanacetum coccineum]